MSEWTCGKVTDGDLVALGPGHPPHYSSKAVGVKGCKGPAFGIFHRAKISLPSAPEKFCRQTQEVPIFCFAKYVKREPPERSQTQNATVCESIFVLHPEQATPQGQTADCRCRGRGAADRGVVSTGADEQVLEPDSGDGGTSPAGLNAPEF